MLSDMVVVVTGGGHGIGEATAIELGTHGATVVVNDLGTSLEGDGADEEPAEETARRVREHGGEAMAHFGDVASLEYTETLVEDTVAEYGRIDGVVNFAGVLGDAMSYKMTGDEWDKVIRVHLRGHFALLRNVAAHWRERARDHDDELPQQRSFLAVTSRSALGNPGQSNYAAAKAGVLGLVRTTARELHRYNIRVNALMPRAFTRMVERVPDEHQPFGEEMAPEKVAPMVAYLLSDEADGVTGCTVHAGGEEIGLVSDPEIYRWGFKDGGWTPAEIADRFQDQVARDEDLERV